MISGGSVLKNASTAHSNSTHPLPRLSQVFILKVVKVLCFDNTFASVILKGSFKGVNIIFVRLRVVVWWFAEVLVSGEKEKMRSGRGLPRGKDKFNAAYDNGIGYQSSQGISNTICGWASKIPNPKKKAVISFPSSCATNLDISQPTGKQYPDWTFHEYPG